MANIHPKILKLVNCLDPSIRITLETPLGRGKLYVRTIGENELVLALDEASSRELLPGPNSSSSNKSTTPKSAAKFSNAAPALSRSIVASSSSSPSLPSSLSASPKSIDAMPSEPAAAGVRVPLPSSQQSNSNNTAPVATKAKLPISAERAVELPPKPMPACRAPDADVREKALMTKRTVSVVQQQQQHPKATGVASSGRGFGVTTIRPTNDPFVVHYAAPSRPRTTYTSSNNNNNAPRGFFTHAQQQPQHHRKIYCQHWIHTGTCNYNQTGCRYKHEIPLREHWDTVGLKELPQWYRDYQARNQRVVLPPPRSSSLSNAPASKQTPLSKALEDFDYDPRLKRVALKRQPVQPMAAATVTAVTATTSTPPKTVPMVFTMGSSSASSSSSSAAAAPPGDAVTTGSSSSINNSPAKSSNAGSVTTASTPSMASSSPTSTLSSGLPAPSPARTHVPAPKRYMGGESLIDLDDEPMFPIRSIGLGTSRYAMDEPYSLLK